MWPVACEPPPDLPAATTLAGTLPAGRERPSPCGLRHDERRACQAGRNRPPDRPPSGLHHRLDGADVLRLRALLAARDLELDPLVLREGPEAGGVDRREVDEQ